MEARAELDAARSQSPASVLPRAFLAQIHLVQNHRELARQEASQLLARSPDSPLARLIFLVKEQMQAFGTAITNFFIPDVSCCPFELKMAA